MILWGKVPGFEEISCQRSLEIDLKNLKVFYDIKKSFFLFWDFGTDLFDLIFKVWDRFKTVSPLISAFSRKMNAKKIPSKRVSFFSAKKCLQTVQSEHFESFDVKTDDVSARLHRLQFQSGSTVRKSHSAINHFQRNSFS